MTVDPASRWYAEVAEGGRLQGFDTPKCALRYLLRQAPGGVVKVRSYYQQRQVSGSEVVFALGSDVLGPMGADLVPIEPEFAAKFRSEHHASQVLPQAQLTLAIVEAQ